MTVLGGLELTHPNRYFYDTEFLEDGRIIDLISVGIVHPASGREYYAVSAEFDQAAVLAHDWLPQHVWPYLPTRTVTTGRRTRIELNTGHPTVKSRKEIAKEVADFLLGDGQQPELWAWFSAYDHVALMQLYGPMINPNRPDALPMFTNDIRHQLYLLERQLSHAVRLPPQQQFEHHALFDARHDVRLLEHIDAVAADNGLTGSTAGPR